MPSPLDGIAVRLLVVEYVDARTLEVYLSDKLDSKPLISLLWRAPIRLEAGDALLVGKKLRWVPQEQDLVKSAGYISSTLAFYYIDLGQFEKVPAIVSIQEMPHPERGHTYVSLVPLYLPTDYMGPLKVNEAVTIEIEPKEHKN